jgi:glycosyltransferase involved in cell wall biosynthesis
MLVSIITVNLNDRVGLERTCASVFKQSFTDYEHIIIDGASVDGSLDYIETHSDKFSYWISEPDSGVYCAMNKGIRQAKGKYLLFLNSGDVFFCNNSLQNVSKDLYSVDFIYSNINVKDNFKEYINKPPKILSFRYLYDNVPPHQATFIRREVFKKFGYYDESLKIVADWKFFLLAVCKYNATYLYLDKTFTTFYIGGISTNPKNRNQMEAERNQVLEKEFSILLEDIRYRFYLERIIRNLKKSKTIKVLQYFKVLNKF